MTSSKIESILDTIKELLLYKNKMYGDSALNPISIFNKTDNVNSIKIRIDDKINRIKNCQELRTNDIIDLIGYLTLLLVSLNISESDILRLKD